MGGGLAPIATKPMTKTHEVRVTATVFTRCFTDSPVQAGMTNNEVMSSELDCDEVGFVRSLFYENQKLHPEEKPNPASLIPEGESGLLLTHHHNYVLNVETDEPFDLNELEVTAYSDGHALFTDYLHGVVKVVDEEVEEGSSYLFSEGRLIHSGTRQ